MNIQPRRKSAESPSLNVGGPLAALIVFVLLASVGAEWFQVLKAGGFTLELSNVGSLVAIGLCGLLVILRRELRAPMVLNVLLVLFVMLIFAMAARGQPHGVVIISLFGILSAYALANVHSLRNQTPVLAAFVAYIGFIALSLIISGVDFIAGFADYLSHFNRARFNAKVMHPIYNAFIAGGADEAYRTQINNRASATFALFYILAGSYALTGQRIMIPVAAISLFAVFLIFSSAAMMVCAIVSLIFFWHWALRVENKLVVLIIVFVASTVFIIVWPTLSIYIEANLLSDSSTREGRMVQYGEALNSIDKNMIFGSGLVTVQVTYIVHIHNIILFSFATAGIAGFIAATYVILYVIWLSLKGLNAIRLGDTVQPEALMTACLPILFLIRCMVGGGGGLPASAGALALGLALVSRRALHTSNSMAQLRWENQTGLGTRDLAKEGTEIRLQSDRSRTV